MKNLFQIEGLRKKRDQRPPRFFVTGATGYLGSAIVRELAGAGYEVAGMTRWAEKTLDVKAMGGRAVVGDLRDSLTYRRVAAEYDVLIHAAQERSDAKVVADRHAIEALLWAANQNEDWREGDPPRVLLYTSGCFVLGDTGGAPAAEDAELDPPEVVAWRPEHERMVLDADRPHLATAVVRPGMLYGGGSGLISGFFRTATEDGEAAYIGDGENRWSPAYLGDVARLYRLIAEQHARGIFHCAEPAATVKDLARAASEAAGAGGRTRSIPLDEARDRMGAAADALVMDQVMAWPRSTEVLGWQPEHRPFTESADAVFEEWRNASK